MDFGCSLFYRKFNSGLTSLILIGIVLLYGSSIILPLLFAILLANILLPSTNYLARKGFGRVFSILIPLATSIIAGGGILFFISAQIASFLDDLPVLNDRLSMLVATSQHWIKQYAHITVFKQNQYLHQAMEALKAEGPQLLSFTFSSLKEIMTYVVIVPIYTFLILFYKHTVKSFLIGIFKNGSVEQVNEILTESTSIAHRYVTGLMIETLIVFSLNLIGFSILGIKYTVFLALLAALLNLIPYVGLLVANLICMLTTLVSSENIGDTLWVSIILVMVHFYDSNFGMPLIVGTKVRINALVIILGVLAGSALCGIPGMFLAIPGLAVLKIIFDKVPEFKPWGILMSDEPIPALKGKPQGE